MLGVQTKFILQMKSIVSGGNTLLKDSHEIIANEQSRRREAAR